MNTHYISNNRLDINSIKEIIYGDYQLALSEKSVENIENAELI